MLKNYITPIMVGLISLVIFGGFAKAEIKEVLVKSQDELELASKANKEEAMKIIIDKEFEFGESNLMYLNYTSDYDLTIDMGNNNLKAAAQFVDSGEGDLLIENFYSEGMVDKELYRLALVIYERRGKFILRNSVFKNNEVEKYGVIEAGGYGGEVTFDNILLENNKGAHSAGIRLSSHYFNARIINSTFKNNQSTSEGAAISNELVQSEIEIINSKFTGNIVDLSNSNETKGAGAIYSNGSSQSMDFKVIDSLFENNKVLTNKSTNKPSSGAISAYNHKENDTLTIKGTTFFGNEGVGGGGALVVNENAPGTSKVILENNTFFQNKSLSQEDNYSSGGAITLYREEKEEVKENTDSKLYSRNNTFLENSITRNEEVLTETNVKGGAMGILNTDISHDFTNNLFIGNYLKNNESTLDPNLNVFISGVQPIQKYNLGFDNGTVSTDTVSQAYGKYPVSLGEHGSVVKAGRKEDATIIPTIMIAPKLNNTVGTANMTGNETTMTDQRGNKRLGKPDIGAVEISSLVYDANGGNFTISKLKKYDGKTYYEGKNPKQYAKVDIPNASYTILNGKKALMPKKTGYEFIGWSDKKGSTQPNVNHGTNLEIEDQMTLYAVWKAKVNLKYYSNGKTVGAVPTQQTIFTDATVTIKSQGKLKRKGYKFSGWSTKPSAKKGEAAYAPGKKLILTKNTKLYAIWKR